MRNILFLLTISAMSVFMGCQQVGSTAKTTTATTAVDAHPKTDEFKRISVADAKKEVDAGTAIIVDARAEAAYKNERIKGSINIPVGEFEARYKELPTDKKVIAYCSCPSEQTSGHFAQDMKAKGLENGYALTGGTNAWKAAGYPIEKSEQK